MHTPFNATASVHPSDFYADALRVAQRNSTRDERLLRRIEVLRVLFALSAIAFWLIRDDVTSPVAFGGSLLAIAAFIVAVRRHGRVRASLLLNRRLALAAKAGQARMARAWSEIPSARPVELEAGWPTSIAYDVDLTGSYSLARLVDVTTLAGLHRLTRWMLGEVADVETIAARQKSVEALRSQSQLLLFASADSRFDGSNTHATLPESFRRWCGEQASISPRILKVSSAVPVAFLVIVTLLLITGDFARANAFGYLFAFANISLSLWVRRAQRADLEEFERAHVLLRSTRGMLELTTAAKPIAGRFGEIQRELQEGGVLSAVVRLIALLEYASVRHSPMLHWVLNALFGFDVVIAWQLESWRARHAERLPLWLERMSETAALLSLGVLAFEHPAWRMPVIHGNADEARLSASGMTHPLLVPSVAVSNDIALQRSGDVIVVSGANMAGKSTFLRAVGLNVLLAQAGSAVAAESFQLHRCRLRTSVRVEDDLGSGTSLFLAEVTRVKHVIDEALDKSRVPVLFILDEVLHGTNAADRRAASQRVLSQLRETDATGVIATHDPAIGEPGDDVAPQHDSHVAGSGLQQIHFACNVVHEPGSGRIRLVFDYRARPGPARESNALAILDLLGLQGH